MRRVVREGPDGEPTTYTEYEIHELGSPPVAAMNHRRQAELALVNRLFGSWNRSGPLMDACRRSAEYESRGGHSPQTARTAEHEFYFTDPYATLVRQRSAAGSQEDSCELNV